MVATQAKCFTPDFKRLCQIARVVHLVVIESGSIRKTCESGTLVVIVMLANSDVNAGFEGEGRPLTDLESRKTLSHFRDCASFFLAICVF